MQQRNETFESQPVLLVCKNSVVKKRTAFFWKTKSLLSKIISLNFAVALPRVFGRLKRCISKRKTSRSTQMVVVRVSTKFGLDEFESLNFLLFSLKVTHIL